MDFFDMKGVMQSLLGCFQIENVRVEPGGLPPFLSPGCSAWFRCEEQTLGWAGELAPAVMTHWDLETIPFIFEMDFEKLVGLGNRTRRFRALPRFPEVVRDLSVLVKEDVAAGAMLDAIADCGLCWFQEASLFDLFQEGEKVPVGCRSLTFRVRYRSAEGSLTDEAVNEQQTKLMEHFQSAFGARLRG
jgi:phenylalanyl-tRNA synthetase beta chain